MEISNLVVARYLDGRVVKGITNDFSPNRGIFHVDPQDGSKAVEVRFRQLKAVFFVASLEGDRTRVDANGFVQAPAETAHGKKLAVRFRDGELMCGYTQSWSPEREGFFLFPSDPHTNNQRVFVMTGATLEIKAGPAAEALAERVLSQPPPAASPQPVRPLFPTRGPLPLPAPLDPGLAGPPYRPAGGSEGERPTGSD